MSLIQRIRSIVAGLFMLLCALLMIMKPEEGYKFTVLLLGLTITANAIKLIAYYATMAIHMVDGKMALYKGIVMLDLGLLALSVIDLPSVYVMLYLAACYLFSGVIGIMRGFEAKKLGGGWRLNLITGVLDIMIGIACIVFVKNHRLAVYIYSAGLVYSAIIKIFSACRKTDIVYVQ